MPKIIAIIPARYGSTRLPGKPLININGKTMIQRVFEQVMNSRYINDIVVATDDIRIIKEVNRFGGKAVLTSKRHKTGTDRIAEVIKNLDYEIIVNVQGDEPFINHRVIDSAIHPLIINKNLNVSTLAVKVKDKISDKNKVKVVFDNNNFALYFSRATIPYNFRNIKNVKNYKHLGLYVYRKDFLLKFNQYAQSDIERTENLEQLRILSMGEKIKIVITKEDSLSIDTKRDLIKVLKQIKGKIL